MKFFRLVSAGLILGLTLSACTAAESNTQEETKLSGSISIDGSSTVFPITELVAEDFNAENNDVQITVGFSGTGENAVKIEPAHRTSRAIASESKSHPEIGWL